MKRNLILLLVGLAVFVGCKQKPQREEIVATQYEIKKPGPPVRMQEKLVLDTVQWGGAAYEVMIRRMAVDSLPMVKDEIGQAFIDNRISLIINRMDGSTVLSKNFSKASFTSYINAEYRKQALLQDMSLRVVSSNELGFNVILAEPEATDDEFLPLKLSVDRSGGITIEAEDNMDLKLSESEMYDED